MASEAFGAAVDGEYQGELLALAQGLAHRVEARLAAAGGAGGGGGGAGEL